MHTIIVAAPDGTRPLRVQCDYCGSQHAYRGGGSDTPREAYTASREVASARVEQRIARTLLRLIRQSGRRTADGIEIEFPITRREIAEMASTTLHTVSRALSGWEQSGVLTGGRRRIVVLDSHALVRIAHED